MHYGLIHDWPIDTIGGIEGSNINAAALMEHHCPTVQIIIQNRHG